MARASQLRSTLANTVLQRLSLNAKIRRAELLKTSGGRPMTLQFTVRFYIGSNEKSLYRVHEHIVSRPHTIDCLNSI